SRAPQFRDASDRWRRRSDVKEHRRDARTSPRMRITGSSLVPVLAACAPQRKAAQTNTPNEARVIRTDRMGCAPEPEQRQKSGLSMPCVLSGWGALGGGGVLLRAAPSCAASDAAALAATR